MRKPLFGTSARPMRSNQMPFGPPSCLDCLGTMLGFCCDTPKLVTSLISLPLHYVDFGLNEIDPFHVPVPLQDPGCVPPVPPTVESMKPFRVERSEAPGRALHTAARPSWSVA